MRLIGTISSQEPSLNPFAFSYFLSKRGIDNEIEEISHEDEILFQVFITDEDQVDEATALLASYRADPNHPDFYVEAESILAEEPEPQADSPPSPQRAKRRFLSSAPYGKWSLLIIFACVGIFFWAQVGRQPPLPQIRGVVQAPYLTPIVRSLLFDYPLYFELRDELVTKYTPQEIQEGSPPSPEETKLIAEMRKLTYWNGLYDRIVDHFTHGTPLAYTGPLFTKIRQGQVWRLFTPAVLHVDLIHIFFNLLWFMLLAHQVEYRLKSFRYLFFIILTAILSNTAQYLMSGVFFMGLSGVVVALAGFIWARQQVAPWEGYLLHRMTVIFLAAFVFGLFFLQLVFFTLTVIGKTTIHLPIANTAHLVGGLSGYLLGRLPTFRLKTGANFRKS